MVDGQDCSCWTFTSPPFDSGQEVDIHIPARLCRRRSGIIYESKTRECLQLFSEVLIRTICLGLWYGYLGTPAPKKSKDRWRGGKGSRLVAPTASLKFRQTRRRTIQYSSASVRPTMPITHSPIIERIPKKLGINLHKKTCMIFDLQFQLNKMRDHES